MATSPISIVRPNRPPAPSGITGSESQEQYRTIIETTHEGVAIADADGLITYASGRFAEMLGYSIAELRGRSIFDFIWPEELPEAAATFERAKNETGLQLERRLNRKAGEPLWVHMTTDPMYGQHGELQGILAVFTDISGRKRLEREHQLASEAQQKANSAKDAFLARVSHELRTPLSAIKGWVHMIRAGKLRLDESGIYRALAIIEQNADFEFQILNDLMDLTKISHGELKLELRPTDLRGVLNAAFESVRPQADAKNIALRTNISSAANEVQGDPLRLQQVMWNLLSNAVRHTPNGGMIRVALRYADGVAHITVADNGCGIPPDLLPHIFEPYCHGQSSDGLGLGLNIARQIVELHGGTITAASEVGQGAKFVVSLSLKTR